VKTYTGNDLKVRSNKKLRQILDRLLEDSRIKRIQLKPTVLQCVPPSKSNKDTEKSSNDVTNVTNVTRSQVHAKAEKPIKKVENDSSDDNATRAHRSYRSHSSQKAQEMEKKEGSTSENIENVGTNATSYVTSIEKRSHSDENSNYYRFMDEKTNEWEMGFHNKFVIARAYGDTWVCKHGSACAKLTSDKSGIWAHAFNHEMTEIKEKLGILKEYSQDMQQHELRQYTRDQLDLLAAQCGHDSGKWLQLEKQILLAKDYLIDGGKI
jgi:hypothetical protein